MNKREACLFLFLIGISYGRELQKEISLSLNWRFELGDNLDYSNPNYDDSEWEYIKVPGCWEDQGFPGHDGFAWYRIRLKIPKCLEKKSLYLMIGRTNDADEVYINGKLIGRSGSFPPDYQAALIHRQICHLEPEFIHFGKTNVIAIRIFNDRFKGGITAGCVGIFSYPKISLAVDLSGKWIFSPGDDPSWAEPGYDDSEWDSLQVPDYWENQGYPFLNGYAWYRKTFSISGELKSDKIILSLGLIDADDVTYFNGQKIGSTGIFPGDEPRSASTVPWLEDRFYLVPSQLIHWNGPNTIAVRIHDACGPGGIYDGPIGLITNERYIKDQTHNTPVAELIERLFNKLQLRY
ncbi:hypothetical protein JW964_00045 [candidate division KSB1 bacterium]|nr:hypothetical protein [candidate division KSB1 bacterium]